MRKLLHKNTQRGFTLIETFVAITILVTAVAGPLTLAQKGLQSAILARDQLIASFLAQEGLELVRGLRDDNSLASSRPADWLANLSVCITSTNPSGCTIDPSSSLIVACSGTCPPLRLDTTYGFYNYVPINRVTPFTRTIKIVRHANGREAKITSTISWRTSIFDRQLVLEDVLFKWQ